MTRRKWFGLILVSVSAAVLPLLLISSPIAANPPLNPPPPQKIPLALRVKIEPRVLKELASGEKTTYLVHLTQQADLAPARRMQGKLIRRQAVVSSLQATADRSQRDVRAYLDGQCASGHVENYIPFWVFNGLAVTGDLETLLALAARPEVEMIRANHKHQLPDPIRDTQYATRNTQYAASLTQVEWNIAQVRADEVWSDFGITGRGVVVANLDTGVDWTHLALQDKYRGADGNHDYNWYDFTDTYPSTPDDGDGHGTHTMGTIVGDDGGRPRYEDGGQNQIGMAPGARWIAVKIFDDSGVTDDVKVHQGFQWILAPTDLDGENPDPSQAPDVVNNSWGDMNGANPAFLPDVQALRAAGIFPVFAAGNSGGMGVGSVHSPASFSHAVAVGATDSADAIASFSGRGPSFWKEVKPEVSAPGVNIRSSVPGGYEGGWSGTSMSTPHVVGLTALLLEAASLTGADPTLTADDLENFMKHTAADLGQPGPDNAFGSGRIDAYEAVRWALGAGKLYGTVRVAGFEFRVSNPPSNLQLPIISGATVSGVSRDGDRFTAATDATGTYTVSVPGGFYDVTARAFGHLSATVRAVEVITAYMSMRDLALKPAPTGTLSGRVTEAGTEEPLTATIRVLDTPASATADVDGFYSLALPAGSYTVEASTRGHHIQRAEVSVAEEAVTSRDFVLPLTPSLLLVDADAWLEENVTLYYQHALDKAGYPHETRPITDTAYLPTAEELGAYDVVIWATPWQSPGYIGAHEMLMDYLDHGGKLLITGQDIGYWDYQQGHAPSFYTDYLHAHFLGEPEVLDELIGGDILEGLTLTLNDTYAYKNTCFCNLLACFYPDEIEPADDIASPIIAYPDGGSRGLKAESPPYRVIYLGFGLESVGPRDALAQTVDQAIAWLTQPSLTKTADKKAAAPGEVLTYTLTLNNIGATDLPEVSLTDPIPEHTTYVPDSATGGASYDPALDQIQWIGTLPAKTRLDFTFQTMVEKPLVGGTVITNTATLDDGQGHTLQSSATTTVLAPNLSDSAKTVDKVVASAGDVLTYTVSVVNSGSMAVPAASLVDPIPANTAYVSGSVTGGAVYNAALDQIEWTGAVPIVEQGYSWTDGDQPGGPIYEWIDIVGIGTPITDLEDDTNTDPLPIGFSFPFYGNEFTQFYLSSNGFLSLSPISGRNFGNLALPNPSAPGNLLAPFWDDLNFSTNGEAYYWSGVLSPVLSPVEGLSKGNEQDTLVVSFVNVPHYGNGGPYTFQVILRADGSITYQYQSMVDPLEEATVGIQNADGTQGLNITYNEAYVHDGLAVRISPPAPPPTIAFQVEIDDPLPPETTITNTATIDDGRTYERQATTRVNTIELGDSTKKVDKSVAVPGEVLTYTLTLRNTGMADAADVTVLDPIPPHTTYQLGSATGGAIYDEGRILWSGPVPSGDQVCFSFAVRIVPPLSDGAIVENTATIEDSVHSPFTRTAATTITAPDLSPSEKRVSSAAVSPGQVLTYTILVKNGGSGPATVTLTDTLPAEVVYVPGSAWAGSGGAAAYKASTHRLTWSGRVPASAMATVRFAVQAAGVPNPVSPIITNRVLLDDGAGNVIEKRVTTGGGERRLFLPLIMKK